ncbi:MAG TPA: non-canonical purine NTP pyrophosphatase [Patescibacteria group bacterium]|nr:non-canonical purine NTP pyrophosphatase [Patescibacteria group bacterium]
MRVFFVTTNPVKIDSVVRVLNARGIGVEVKDLDIPEIQAETASEVAAAKALEAFRIVQAPVLVNDFAFHIDALNGWPGAYVKTESERLGLGMFLQMLRKPEGGHLSHRGRLANALGYMDARLDAPKVFAREVPGTLSPAHYEALPEKKGQWVHKIFVPDGETMPVGQMPPHRFDAWRKRGEVEGYYHELADWLLARDVPAD